METFHIFHLAASWQAKPLPIITTPASPPLTTSPVIPSLSLSQTQPSIQPPPTPDAPRTKIRAAAAQMVFASRSSQEFITPEKVLELEEWSGRGVLEALRGFEIRTNVSCSIFLPSLHVAAPNNRSKQNLHPEEGSVWELS